MSLREEFEEQAKKKGLDISCSINDQGIKTYNSGLTVLDWLQWVANNDQLKLLVGEKQKSTPKGILNHGK